MAHVVEFLDSRKGPLTVKVDGLFIHSRYDPQKEADDLAAEYIIPQYCTVIVLGCGLGYHLRALYEKARPFNSFIVVEPSKEIFDRAFEVNDLSFLQNDKRVEFFVEKDAQEIYDSLTNRILRLMSAQIVVVDLKASLKIFAEYYTPVIAVIKDAIRLCSANRNTMVDSGLKVLQNAIYNIPYYVRSVGFKELTGRFAGVPAIIVSAGPSLNRNVHLLKQAKGRILIVATDTALKILLKHGVKPDLVFTIDYKAISEAHFKNADHGGVPLVFDIDCANESVAAHGGPYLPFSSQKPFPILINSLSEDKGVMNKGMSVAHSIFTALLGLECSPIIFVGQDLSFPGGRSHADGTDSCKVIGEDPEFSGKGMITIRSEYDGCLLPTRTDMYLYKIHFEKLIRVSKALCINATEGGAGIKGALPLTLQDVIDRYARDDIDIDKNIADVLALADNIDFSDLSYRMKGIMDNIGTLVTNSEYIISILDNVFEQIEKNGLDRVYVAEQIRKTEHAAGVIQRQEFLLRALQSQLIEQIMQSEREGLAQPKDFITKDDAEFIESLREDYKFQKAINEAAGFLKECFEHIKDDLP